MLDRAEAAGVERLVVTGGSLAESRAAVELARGRPGLLACTVGCHPTRATEMEEAETDQPGQVQPDIEHRNIN